MKASMVTMTMTLDGYRIDETLGVVRGIVVRSRSLFGTIGASLQTLVGGNITLMTELCERTRADAVVPAQGDEETSAQDDADAEDDGAFAGGPLLIAIVAALLVAAAAFVVARRRRD